MMLSVQSQAGQRKRIHIRNCSLSAMAASMIRLDLIVAECQDWHKRQHPPPRFPHHDRCWGLSRMSAMLRTAGHATMSSRSPVVWAFSGAVRGVGATLGERGRQMLVRGLALSSAEGSPPDAVLVARQRNPPPAARCPTARAPAFG